MHFTRVSNAILLVMISATLCRATSLVFTVSDTRVAIEPGAIPVSARVDLTSPGGVSPELDRLQLIAADGGKPTLKEPIPVQFEPDTPGSRHGTIWWLMPPGWTGQDQLNLAVAPRSLQAVMQARKDSASGRWDLSDAGKPILSYNYQTIEPGALLADIRPENRKYAQPRSDYIHPLYGPEGEVLTKDWPVDHPHHRGVYWAWPEVDYRGERGDLHALQRVFARPTGQCSGRSGPVFAQVEVENLWMWEDQEPIVRERAIIRAWRASTNNRFIDLEFQFTALKDDVAIARRETKFYGGLNIRLASVKDQQIKFHTDSAESKPRRAWAELSGIFSGGTNPAGLAVFQKPSNPDYPGDWIQYPEINWFQPTFPAAGTRYRLKKDQTLTLQYRLWIHTGKADAAELTNLWTAYANPPEVTVGY